MDEVVEVVDDVGEMYSFLLKHSQILQVLYELMEVMEVMDDRERQLVMEVQLEVMDDRLVMEVQLFFLLDILERLLLMLVL